MRVRIFQVADSNWDPFTSSTDPAVLANIRQTCVRIRTYTPWFDLNKGAIKSIPQAYAYMDLYAIYNPAIYPNQHLATDHPEWIMHDGAGNKLYIPYGPSPISQYAGDIGNPAFRAYQISQVKQYLAANNVTPYGYRGIWLDDVNLQMSVANATGTPVAPVDFGTGKPMTLAAWQSYVVALLEALRTALPPSVEIIQNSVWFVPGSSVVDRQIVSADVVWCERGFGDVNLKGGTGPGTLDGLMKFIDHVHALGCCVAIGEYFLANQVYTLACYFLVNNGNDYYGIAEQTPATWTPATYGIDLGYPLGSRYAWDTLVRRDFSRGIVVINGPGAPTTTMGLPRPMTDTSGKIVSSVTLGPMQGQIFRDQ